MSTEARSIEALETDWRALRPHHERGALFLVSKGADLRTVALAIAEDRSDEVAALIASERLRRASAEEAALWNDESDAHRFRFAIVQPYIVAERLRDTDDRT
jgi:hypothetical protein